METIWEHNFRDGSRITLLYKEFKQAKREVPTLQFFFRHDGRNKILEVPFYDRHTGQDLLPSFVEAVKPHLPEEEPAITVEDAPAEPAQPKTSSVRKPKKNTKVCTECQREFIPNSPAQKKCNLCKMSPEERKKLEEKLDAEADEPEIIVPMERETENE